MIPKQYRKGLYATSEGERLPVEGGGLTPRHGWGDQEMCLVTSRQQLSCQINVPVPSPEGTCGHSSWGQEKDPGDLFTITKPLKQK